MNFRIRKIELRDNDRLAEIIREIMSEFDADPKTTIIGDPALNTMYNNYQKINAAYYVVDLNEELVGGCGIDQLKGGDEKICELQRMFLLKKARRLGIGRQLLSLCIKDARSFNYSLMYLETLSSMYDAISLYENSGFKKIETPLGSTGHTGCNVNMLLVLD